jgi:hypothetical protein
MKQSRFFRKDTSSHHAVSMRACAASAPQKHFDRPVGSCVGILRPASHIAYFHGANPAGSATPENRRRCGSIKRPPKQTRIRRGLGRRSPMCRTGFHRDATPDRSRSATPIGRCHAGCRRAWRWCRRERRRNRCASNRGGRQIGGGRGRACRIETRCGALGKYA